MDSKDEIGDLKEFKSAVLYPASLDCVRTCDKWSWLQLEKMKVEFYESHELKTPLAGFRNLIRKYEREKCRPL